MSIDLRRMRSLIQGPGIDTRTWVSLGVVQSVELNDEGIIAEVALLPNEDLCVCDIASAYAGNGFGFVSVPHEGDTVVVCVPSGDTDFRPAIIGTLWSKIDAPPSEAALPDFNATQDVFLRVENEKSLRIITSGGGNVSIDVRGAGNVNIKVDTGVVRLGNDTNTALDGVVHGSGFDPFTGQTYTALQNASSKVFARKT
jgi:uncharacterized protein involved in type VI secretion and phage assembly